MFPTRFFPDRYFAPRYWPKTGQDLVVVSVDFGELYVMESDDLLVAVADTDDILVNVEG